MLIYITFNYIFQELMNEGHAASQLILQIHDKIVELDDLGDKPKSIIMEKLAVSTGFIIITLNIQINKQCRPSSN